MASDKGKNLYLKLKLAAGGTVSRSEVICVDLYELYEKQAGAEAVPLREYVSTRMPMILSDSLGERTWNKVAAQETDVMELIYEDVKAILASR